MLTADIAKLATYATAASCSLAAAQCDLTIIKSTASSEEGAGELDPSLKERIDLLETAVATLQGSLATIHHCLSELQYAKKEG